MDYASYTDYGNRENNEDCLEIFDIEDARVFVVADGLGGHGHGEIASKETVNSVKKTLTERTDLPIEIRLRASFDNAHATLKMIQEQLQQKASIKSTLVTLIVGRDYTLWGHIGDTRLYHFVSKTLIERSLDHTVPQMLAIAGEIKDKDIRTHEDRNRLLKVIGSEEAYIEPFISTKEPRVSDEAYILCTDGFWEYIDELKMQKLLRKSRNCETWLEAMRKVVRKNSKNKNSDNNTAIVLRT